MNMPEIDIYTTRYCPYCIAAKRLLTHKGVTFTEIDVSGDQIARSKMVVRANGRMTVPQIFIGAIHVGGYDDLYALDQTGKLDPLLGTSEPLNDDQEPSA
jgi:glutaredoxin 3